VLSVNSILYPRYTGKVLSVNSILYPRYTGKVCQ